jgi:hypothetical protein
MLTVHHIYGLPLELVFKEPFVPLKMQVVDTLDIVFKFKLNKLNIKNSQKLYKKAAEGKKLTS